jgi:DivIVA domain-containing protein
VALVLLYLVVLVLVAIVLFGAASLLFGRGEQLPPLPRGTTATVLPAFGVTGSDVDAVKFTQVLRGYKASEVDWVLDRLARELEALRGQLAAVHAAAAAKASQASHASDAEAAEAAEAAADGLELPDGPDAGDHRHAT